MINREVIMGLSVIQLEELAEALLGFTTIADLADWLGQQGNPSELS